MVNLLYNNITYHPVGVHIRAGYPVVSTNPWLLNRLRSCAVSSSFNSDSEPSTYVFIYSIIKIQIYFVL